MARKLKWGTVEYLRQIIDDYFDGCTYDPRTKKLKAPTIAGLCLHIDITKESWWYYTGDGNRWRTSYRKAKDEALGMSDNEAQAIDDEIAERDIYDEALPIGIIEASAEAKGKGYDDSWDLGTKAAVSRALKKALLCIEEFNNQMLYNLKNPAGAIFYLKNAFMYSDKPAELAAAIAASDPGSRLQITISLDNDDVADTGALTETPEPAPQAALPEATK